VRQIDVEVIGITAAKRDYVTDPDIPDIPDMAGQYHPPEHTPPGYLFHDHEYFTAISTAKYPRS
jgi:hypothetical protein